MSTRLLSFLIAGSLAALFGLAPTAHGNPAHAKSKSSASHAKDMAGGAKRILRTPISDAPSYAKYALVVGVTDYDSCPQLHVCNNDAKEFADLLKTNFGFTDVVLMTDDPSSPGSLRPTQRHLQKALATLYGGILPGKSEVVLFFSGHGTRARNLAGTDADWLVPEDGEPSDVPHTCIDYDAIKQRLDTLRPARVLLFTDACRSLLNGKGLGTGSGFGKGLHGAPLGPQVAELLSCQPTEVSQEGLPSDFSESVFTHYLIKGLKGDPDALDNGSVTFDSLKEYVQGSVHDYVAAKFGNTPQTPDGRASYGEMVLARVLPPAAPDALPAPDIAPAPAPSVVRSLTAEEQTAANAALFALWQGDAKMVTAGAVKQDLDAGADVNAKDTNGETALMEASFYGYADIAQMLIDHGADANAKNTYGCAALMMATFRGHADIAQILIDHGADVNAKSNDGEIALMEATFRGHADIAQMLIDHGADVNAKSNDGETALRNAETPSPYVSEYDKAKTIAVLKAAGAKE